MLRPCASRVRKMAVTVQPVAQALARLQRRARDGFSSLSLRARCAYLWF